jgi:hypothetical protein
MLAFLITCWAAFLHLFGVPAASRASVLRNNCPRQKKHDRTKARRPPRRRRRRLHLPRVHGPRSALRFITDMTGQTSGIRREPHPSELELVWMILGEPVSAFVQALIARRESVPVFRPCDDEEAEMDRLFIKACRSPRVLIEAIWLGAPIKASLQAESMLARRLERLFGGAIPQPVVTKNAGPEREWHVVDQYDRPLICRIRERADGRLQILDRGGGWLHSETLRRSHWRLVKGWLHAPFQIPAFNNAEDEGAPIPEPQPNPLNPNI